MWADVHGKRGAVPVLLRRKMGGATSDCLQWWQIPSMASMMTAGTMVPIWPTPTLLPPDPLGHSSNQNSNIASMSPHKHN